LDVETGDDDADADVGLPVSESDVGFDAFLFVHGGKGGVSEAWGLDDDEVERAEDRAGDSVCSGFDFDPAAGTDDDAEAFVFVFVRGGCVEGNTSTSNATLPCTCSIVTLLRPVQNDFVMVCLVNPEAGSKHIRMRVVMESESELAPAVELELRPSWEER